MIHLQCPVCHRSMGVRATSRPVTATCAHRGTIHDAKKIAVMVRVPEPTDIAS